MYLAKCEVIFNKQVKLASLETSLQMLRPITNPAMSYAHELCGNSQPLHVCSPLHAGRPRLPSQLPPPVTLTTNPGGKVTSPVS